MFNMLLGNSGETVPERIRKLGQSWKQHSVVDMPVDFFFFLEVNPEYSLEGLMLKLKLQYFGYLL